MNLDRHSLGIVISRVIGIYVLVQAIGYVAFAAANIQDVEATISSALPAFIALLATLGISYFFLAHASRASRFLMNETREVDEAGTMDHMTVLRTAFLVMGGFLLFRAIPALIGHAALYVQDALVGPRAIAHALESIVQLLLGLYMVIGGGSWDRFLRKLRS